MREQAVANSTWEMKPGTTLVCSMLTRLRGTSLIGNTSIVCTRWWSFVILVTSPDSCVVYLVQNTCCYLLEMKNASCEMEHFVQTRICLLCVSLIVILTVRTPSRRARGHRPMVFLVAPHVFRPSYESFEHVLL